MTTRNGFYQSPFEDYLSFDELEQELLGKGGSSRNQRAQPRGRPAPQRPQQRAQPRGRPQRAQQRAQPRGRPQQRAQQRGRPQQRPQHARSLGHWLPRQSTAHSEYVRWAQHVLNTALGLRLLEDGIMAPATRAAIRDFQRREGLPADGILGPPTQAALANVTSDQQPPAQNGSEPAPQDSGDSTPQDGGDSAPQDGGQEQFMGDLIPDQWRSWEHDDPTPELETIDPSSPAHTRWLQNSLNQVLGLRLPVNGTMNPAVRSALRSFQFQRGLPEHSELSDELEAELVGAGAAPHRHGEDEGEAYLGDLWDKITGTASRLASGLGGLGGGGSYRPTPGKSSPPTPSTAPTGDAGAKLRSQIAAVASAEWERWKRGAIKEDDPAIRSVLADYWKTGVGWLPTQTNWWSAVPWSAAFISWVVKKAGTGNSFKYSSAHAVYTAWAKQNKLAGNSSPFKAYRISEVAPRVGDIVCKDRGSGATYDNIREGMATHCDIVVNVKPNSITTIGGNLSQSVGQGNVPTDAQGRISKPGYFAVIRVGDAPATVPPPAGPPAPGTFKAVPVENPGGGRIKDKTPPQVSDLVAVPGSSGQSVQLHRLAAAAWQAMVSAARADGLADPLLRPTSGYRDPERQARLWREALARYGSPEKARKWVAPPGSSAHQSGRAIDLYLGGKNDSSNVANLRQLPTYRWLVANAQRFGFYPYEQEPWHWEYNPPAR